MRLGDIANEDAARYGKPLDGVRVLAAEQMQALPYATQLLARLGAEVVKVEHPMHGESGRGSSPAMIDPEGRTVGATYLRNNLDKRSVGIDLQVARGPRPVPLARPALRRGRRELQGRARWTAWASATTTIAAVHPRAIYVSISGFGNTGELAVPRLAGVRVDRRGDVGHLRLEDRPRSTAGHDPGRRARRHQLGAVRRDRHPRRAAPPRAHRRGPVRRHRDARRHGRDDRRRHQLLVAGRAARARQGARRSSARASARPTATSWCRSSASTSSRSSPSSIGHPEWNDDPRFATRAGWGPHLETVIRPAVEAWASQRTKLEAAQQLTEAGIVAGPSNHAPDVIADPARRGAQHARGDAPHRRRRRAGPRPRQPGEAVEGGRRPRDAGAVGRRAHRRGADRRARPRRRRASPRSAHDGVVT